MNRAKFVLLGHPVSHSVSPAIHSAVYGQLGLDCEYVTIDCPDEAALAGQLDRIRRGELAGANITVPWKREALALADEVDESARSTGAANVIVRSNEGKLVAHNTDAPALAALLSSGAQEAIVGASVLGSGGAASAAVVACKLAGAAQVWVSSRKWGSGSPASWPKVELFRALGALPVRWVSEPGESGDATTLGGAARRSQLIVQASSAGMLGVGEGHQVCEVLPWGQLNPAAFCYDVVYNPPQTPFLSAAQKAGLLAEGGLSMLVGQAALAVWLWLGVRPEQAHMLAAAREAIFGPAVPVPNKEPAS